MTEHSESPLPTDPADLQTDREVFSGTPVTPEALNTWAAENGFTHGRQGTFWDAEDRAESQNFLYIKPCHIVPSEAAAAEALAFTRALTERGIFYQETQWGILKRSDDEYQLFASTPRLGDFLDDAPSGELPTPGYLDDQVHKLRDKIDPELDPQQDPPKDSILTLLNQTEASHSNNWGWGPDGQPYPIDVEIIQFSSPDQQMALHNWYIRETQQA